MTASSKGSMPSPSGAESKRGVTPVASSISRLELRKAIVVDEVGSAERDDFGLVGQAGTIAFKLAANDPPCLDRIVAGRIDEMQQQFRSFDMAKETVADARALGGALDQTRECRQGRTRGPCAGRRRAAGAGS